MNMMRCLACESTVSLVKKGVLLVCPACETGYPLVGGKTPVLLKEPTAYLASAYLTLDRQIRADEQKFEQVAGQAANYPLSAKRLAAIAEAERHNHQIFEELLNDIDPHVSKRDLSAATDRPRSSVYMTLLEYLKRDWCWTAGGEQEINITKDTLAPILENLGTLDKALMMGGGMGRLAFELADFFEQITVIDYSLGMSHLFQKLLDEDVAVYDIINKNLEEGENALKLRKASISPDGKGFGETQRAKVTHYVADAKETPVPDDDLSVYFSIYFTDVLPLSQLLPEVKRVLKDQGYYIHFGPLDYHFDDAAEMYSGDELIEYFAKEGFKLLTSSSVTTNHCETEHVFHIKTYQNLVYCFQLTKETPVSLMGKEVLRLNQGYNVSYALGVENEVSAEIRFDNGEVYEGADLIVLILQEIDGQKSVDELVKLFVERGLLASEESSQLFSILEGFVDSGVLAVVL